MSIEHRIEQVIEQVKKVLDSNKNPQIAENVDHVYADKFKLAEFVIDMTLGAITMNLEQIGLKDINILKKAQYVTLACRATRTCAFIKKTTRTVESDSASVIQVAATKIKSYVETKITEHLWNLEVFLVN